MPTCDICGHDRFKPAPFNRLSREGLPPVCEKCGALERHRIGRNIVLSIRDRALFASYDLLQLSRDPIVAQGWFRSVEVSIYGIENSIDIQAIPRADGQYGFIVCSHIIEHVPDHRRAIKELVRVLSPDGLMFLAYPAPATRAVTSDWGYPDPKQHGHFRLIGRDFEKEYADIIPGVYVFAVRGTDSVTGDDDIVYLVSKSFEWAKRLARSPLDVRLL